MGNSNLMSSKSKLSRSEKKPKNSLSPIELISVKHGINIKINGETGLLEGFPKEWAEAYDLDLPIDRTKLVECSELGIHVRPSKLT